MRKKIYQLVHVYEGDLKSVIYKYFMIFVILLSFFPLMIKTEVPAFKILDIWCLVIFFIDYILRWVTADYLFGDNSKKAFARYPFRAISIIDFLSIFALFCSVLEWSVGLKTPEVLIVFRIIRIFRYSKSIQIILQILKRSKKSLVAVGGFAIGYIVISAIIIFNVEPESFKSFFDAIYWATISLTTVGYGDIYPVTNLGRLVAMFSSFCGIAIVALPAGIVTAEYINSFKGNSDE